LKRRTRIFTPAEQTEILAAIKDTNFRDFVFALQQTGCRPSEVARLTAANVNLDLGIWVFDQHKTAKRIQKPRVVYLNPTMLELSRKLVSERPQGPLFPSYKLGRPFTKNAIRCRFRRLRKKLPHLKHFVCYNLRHSYATDALANGVSAAQVAELLGHNSIRMIEQHYGHLGQKVSATREAAAKAAKWDRCGGGEWIALRARTTGGNPPGRPRESQLAPGQGRAAHGVSCRPCTGHARGWG
jgi:integrase